MDSRRSDDNSERMDDDHDTSNSTDVPTTQSGRPPDMLVPASPPKFISMQQLTDVANAFYNMSLAHEITVDSDFRLEKYELPEESLANVVKQTMHRAFWDLLRSSLDADPPDYEPAIRLLTEIKESMNSLVLPSQAKLQRVIDESLDIEAARTEMETTGSLNMAAYVECVVGLMKQFCAPIRDQEVEALRSFTDPVEAFRNAFTLLEKMHMDFANFTIAQMRPYIRQQAVAYERAKFADFLEAQSKLGFDGLVLTRQWITQAYTKLVQKNASSSTPCCNQSVQCSVPLLDQSTRSHPPPSNQSSQPSASSSNQSSQPSASPSNQSLQPSASPFDQSVRPSAPADPMAPTPYNILREAYLMLLLIPSEQKSSMDDANVILSGANGAITRADWPETMLMDRNRLEDLGVQFSNMTVLTSLVLVACNCVAQEASSLFPESLMPTFTSRPEAMTVLKRAICRDVLMILDNSEHGQLSSISPIVVDQLVLTLERWYAALLSPPESPGPIASTSVTHPGLPVPFARQLRVQCDQVVNGHSPVYQLMRDRALAFLRSALASYPPEPLSLPPGFSVLNDVQASRQLSSAGPSRMTSGRQVNHNPPPDRHDHDESPRRRRKKSSMSKDDDTLLSLSELAGRLLPLLAHNRHVFGPHYAEIIQQLLLAQPSVGSA